MIRKLFFPVILSLFASVMYAQSIRITGSVVDSQGEPIIGATIVEAKKASNGTVTDFDGKFTLNASEDAVLVFSYVGMETQEVSYTGAPMLVTMLDESLEMDEFVVIGYQSVKKADLTGAVSVFKPDEMKNTIVTGGIGSALASVPGLFVRGDSKPGGGSFVEIRGTSTFGSGTPLYVIDGVPSSAGRDFNFNDVESVQVLKDASAAAIYGSRAANGVIIITTKSGKDGKMKIEASSRATLQWSPRYDLMNREQFIALNDLGYINGGAIPQVHTDGNTDWQDEVLKMGIVQDHNVSFSGGSKKAKYFLSANYQDNSGTTIGTSSERFTMRANTSAERDFGSAVTFRIGENLTVSHYDLENLNCTPYQDMYRMLPTIPVYDENNKYGWGYGGAGAYATGPNPIGLEETVETTNRNLRIQGNAFAELELFKQFKYRFNFGFEHNSENYTFLRKEGVYQMSQNQTTPTLEKRKGTNQTMVFDNLLEWGNNFNGHDIRVLGGLSYMTNAYERLTGTKTDPLSTGDGYFYELNAATGEGSTGSYRNEHKLFSMFARINYGYDNRYLFSATVRRDESSRFAPENRVGVFPSVSVAWRISQEDFWNVEWMDDLKIRANYGILGSQNIGNYDWMSLINLNPEAVFGDDQHTENGMTTVQITNRDLKWEELHQINAGIDAAFLSNRLTLSADYFVKETHDILTSMDILISTGNSGGNPTVNAASLKNTGFEAAITWRDEVGDFSYSADLGASYVKNTILDLGYDREFFDGARTRSVVGKSIGQWYLVKADGLFRSMEDVYNHVNSEGMMIQPNAQPGDIRYIDYNGDGKITQEDRQYCGESVPAWRLSLNLNFAYKGFDLSAQFQGALGYKIFNGARASQDSMNDNVNYRASYDAFHETDNPNGVDPRPIFGDGRNSFNYQDRWLENGDYLRLSQLAIGYTFPESMIGPHFQGIRLFAAAQNLFTLTKYTGLDPVVNSGSIWERSFDSNQYPTPMGMTFGATITF